MTLVLEVSNISAYVGPEGKTYGTGKWSCFIPSPMLIPLLRHCFLEPLCRKNSHSTEGRHPEILVTKRHILNYGACCSHCMMPRQHHDFSALMRNAFIGRSDPFKGHSSTSVMYWISRFGYVGKLPYVACLEMHYYGGTVGIQSQQKGYQPNMQKMANMPNTTAAASFLDEC